MLLFSTTMQCKLKSTHIVNSSSWRQYLACRNSKVFAARWVSLLLYALFSLIPEITRRRKKNPWISLLLMDLELDRSITYVLIVHTLEKRLFRLRGHLSSCPQSTSYDQGVWVELSMEYLIHAQSTHQS